jgi:hypothetical protein
MLGKQADWDTLPDLGRCRRGQRLLPLTGRGATRRREVVSGTEYPVRKALMTLAAAAAIIFSAALPTAAFAASGPALACRIAPNSDGTYHPGFCGTNRAASSYTIAFEVQGGSGTYTYTWTYPSGYTVSGCTSASDICTMVGVHATTDVNLAVTVVIHQGSSSATLSASASIAQVCGINFC